jgi:alpha-glucosidase (family GH31 glycosyl hydrolase)
MYHMRKIFLFSSILVLILGGLWIFSPRPTVAAPAWQTFKPPAWMLGPIEGDEGNEATILNDFAQIEKFNLPITAYHFDGNDWQTCPGDAQFGYSGAVLKQMRARNIRALFWIVPLIAVNCPDYQYAVKHKFFVKNAQGNVIITDDFQGNGSWLDFNNPDAVAYWHSSLDKLLGRVGNLAGGFYIDDVRVAYGEAFAQDLLTYTRTHIPDGDVIFKRYGENTPSDTWLTANAHAAYVNDLPTNFSGMEIGIERVFDTSTLMPLAYNEFSGYGTPGPDTETLIRRFHFGAFQPVMEDVPEKGAPEPWDSRYPPEVMQLYQYYANLHAELVPYLHSYDEYAYETHTPMFRNINSKHDSAELGNEFFVQFVNDYETELNVRLPAGTWINYWKPKQILNGGTSISNFPVPLGNEPIFIEAGAIIPMHVSNSMTGHGTTRSVGSLTLDTYPISQASHSTFHYYDDANGWLDFDMTKNGMRLALCTLNGLPSQPLIWRVNQMKQAPASVTLQNGAVGINTTWGTALTPRPSEGKGDGLGGW